MINPKKLEQVAQQIHNALPQSVKNFGDDAEAKIKQILQSQLSKLDVITRDEFDVQTQILLRTRQKLEALEARFDILLKEENKTEIESEKSSSSTLNN